MRTKIAQPVPRLRLSQAAGLKVRHALPLAIRARLDCVAARLGLTGEKFIEKLLRAGVENLEEDFANRDRAKRRGKGAGP